ncbi:MAG TPA: bifunctional oligoribonuclease/PAP phosphatase NrnA, partial [Bacillota bacterium]|nr:bifunctional oligoribonuclease/PAP phosphatase NrnA [Bacillota bacterium]
MVKQQIIEWIQAYERIIIHRHVRPDPDAYGSQAGLQRMIQLSFPKKEVYIVGEEDPDLHYLARMDEISNDKYNDALVIVCDTANTGRICDQRYKLGKKIVKIDHHPNVDPYGDLLWVDTDASSTSEMIYELFLAGKDNGLVLDAQAARLIYAGIVGDTGRFLFPSTTPKTFTYVAELVSYEFDRSELYDGMYNVKQNIARLRGHILKDFTISDNGVSTVKLPQDILATYDVNALESGQLVRTLGDIEGIIAWAFFVEEKPGLIRVRLRSKGPVINEIAARFNGGGHPLASGATV